MENRILEFLPSIKILVDKKERENIKGRLEYGRGREEEFRGIEELLIKIEEEMDKRGQPRSSVKLRSYKEKKREVAKRTEETRDRRKRESAMRGIEKEERRGEKATFVLQVRFRQNATWQGTVKWLEKKEVRSFRSALELIKIIDSACEAGYEVEVRESIEGAQ